MNDPACVCAKLPQSYPTLCIPMGCSLPGSSVHGILQARILEWVAMPTFKGSSRPRDWNCISYISCIGRQVLYHWATWEAPLLIAISWEFMTKMIFRNLCMIAWHFYNKGLLYPMIEFVYLLLKFLHEKCSKSPKFSFLYLWNISVDMCASIF